MLENVAFHNTAELESRLYLPGLRLQRFPKQVRESLTEKGRTKAAESSGCEIRFVTEAANIRVTMAAQEKDGRVLVFRGDLFHAAYDLKAGVVTTLQLEAPERFAEVPPALLDNVAFSSKVWRIYCGRFTAIFYDIDAYGFAIRPPDRQEIPRLTMLAYGSSITQGAGALSHYNGYVQQTARRLGTDVLNLGLSGSCYCEPELADHLAEREDWDLAYLELGVNMRGTVSTEEFQHRATYLLDGIIRNHPTKPILVTTIYPNRATYFHDSAHPFSVAEKQFNDVLKRYVESREHANLTLLDGAQIMIDFTSLTSDLIHPSDYGHSRMAEQLAGFLRPSVDKLRAAQG
ncbi:SGNH/GDSL hydrolase family protein [Paenibacillus sp. Soil750]|uniref:SGNH/GDSL hydrolase family protein n=1 Tax=Paenibacillus sp. Soil750 TaxID=1736398 RepID=UPI0006FB850C|nr:SGNH/GDSL hydrolase family protein [Paenibacillus sp. Soil750]KRE58023.1 lipase [Paenibacillus sp. Soil750]